jgi:hypothetical protein
MTLAEDMASQIYPVLVMTIINHVPQLYQHFSLQGIRNTQDDKTSQYYTLQKSKLSELVYKHCITLPTSCIEH